MLQLFARMDGVCHVEWRKSRQIRFMLEPVYIYIGTLRTFIGNPFIVFADMEKRFLGVSSIGLSSFMICAFSGVVYLYAVI